MTNLMLTNHETQQPGLLTAAAISPLGPVVPGTSAPGRLENKWRNGLINYFGRIFASQRGEVFELNTALTVWTSVLASVGGLNQANSSSGLYPVLVGGNPRLIGISNLSTSNTNHNIITHDPIANTWAVTPNRVNPGSTQASDLKGGWTNGSLIQNNLYTVVGNTVGTKLLIYDSGADTMALLDPLGGDGAGAFPYTRMAINVYKELPFFNIRSGNDLLIRSIQAGADVAEATIANVMTGHSNNSRMRGKDAMFLDPNNDDLILFYLDHQIGGAGESGWQAARISGAPGAVVVNDISASVLPAALTAAAVRDNEQWYSFADQQTAPGTTVIKLFLFSQGDIGGTGQRYTWINNATPITVNEALAFSAVAIPNNNFESGGERVFTAAKIIGGIEGTPVGSVGFDTVTFRLTDRAGPSSGKQVQFYWRDPNGEHPDVLADLQNPSAGSISGGNLLTGLNADVAPGIQNTVEVLVPGTLAGDRLRLTIIAG